MRAVVAVLGQVALLNQSGDFLRCETVAGFNRGFAGDHVQQVVDEIANVGCFAAAEDTGYEIAKQCAREQGLDLPMQR